MVADLMESAKAPGEYREDVGSLLTPKLFALYFTELTTGLNEDSFSTKAVLFLLCSAAAEMEAELIVPKEAFS